MINLFYGTNIYTHIMFWVGMAVVAGDFFATIFTIIYQKSIYKKRRARYNGGYAPRCSVVIPCKGIPKNFGDNLRGFLRLDYPDFEVIYVTESADDAAVPEIKKILAEDSRAKFAVAGLATECAQKNHNMLAALREVSDNSEVFVFADSDIKPAAHWLKEIVLPLQDQKVTVTTGFRWLISAKGTVGELCHAYVNIFIYTCFCAACYFGGVGLWGGTMAIRRRDFEELGVAKKWSRASVDDMSLSALVLRSRRKAVVVSTCLTVTDDLLPTVGSTVSWFERQIMYFKSYQTALWVFPTFFIALIAGILLLLLPVAAAAHFFTPYSFWDLGGGVSITFIVGHTLTAFLYPMLGKMPYYGRFLLLQPFLRVMQMVSYMKTWCTATITWAGIKYRLSSNGDVKSMKR
ncbi:MAG: glycosyltransferase family 2 protein [Chitinispirillia bacterium]|nr:glycosyltransferase family 2 protein [Chitinispirillia bacterium]MCL2267949.1 glycosyltransferase family 2 protein [Chitinispirillia bacterium]